MKKYFLIFYNSLIDKMHRGIAEHAAASMVIGCALAPCLVNFGSFLADDGWPGEPDAGMLLLKAAFP